MATKKDFEGATHLWWSDAKGKIVRAKITKVGRLYIHIKGEYSGFKVAICDLREVTSFGTARKFYTTAAAAKDSQEKAELYRLFRREAQSYLGPSLSLGQLRRIMAIVEEGRKK